MRGLVMLIAKGPAKGPRREAALQDVADEFEFEPCSLSTTESETDFME